MKCSCIRKDPVIVCICMSFSLLVLLFNSFNVNNINFTLWTRFRLHVHKFNRSPFGMIEWMRPSNKKAYVFEYGFHVEKCMLPLTNFNTFTSWLSINAQNARNAAACGLYFCIHIFPTPVYCCHQFDVVDDFFFFFSSFQIYILFTLLNKENWKKNVDPA